MSRLVNGFLGNFTTVAALTDKFDPAEYAGCSANVGTAPPYHKVWSDGDTWAGINVADGVFTLADGSVFVLSEVIPEVLATASAGSTALTGPGNFAGYRCTTATGNITVYDNTSATGKVLVPTTALTVGSFPIYGAGHSGRVKVNNGVHVVLSGAAVVYVGVEAD